MLLSWQVDDDSFVHIPNLLDDIQRIACHPFVYYGLVAHTGYSPMEFNTCGFSWTEPTWNLRDAHWNGPWHQYKCGASGYHLPVPFVTGALQIMSAGLVRHCPRPPWRHSSHMPRSLLVDSAQLAPSPPL